jgi:branched-chain amino acid transport system permease protein
VPCLFSRAVVQYVFFMLTMLVLAMQWNMLAGFVGLVSVGQQAFVGIGAYAMFACVIFFGWDPLVGLLVGGVAAAVLAIPTAFFVFRLQGAYFAIGTWVVAEVTRLLLAQWKMLGGGTGASLPKGTTTGMMGVGAVHDLLHMKPAQVVDSISYWLALVLAVATLIVSYRVLRSKTGLGLRAMRDNVGAARSVGVHATRLKAWVFLLVAFGTGICGALIYLQKARISPDSAFSLLDWTAYVIFIVVIGGIGTLEGPIVGVLVFFVLQHFLADYGSLYLVSLGLIGICVMLFAPGGLWGVISAMTGIEVFRLSRRLPNPTVAEAERSPSPPHGERVIV